MDTHKQNYLFAREVLSAVADADRKDEIAQMGRLLTSEELDKIRGFVELCEDQGIRLVLQSN